MIQTILIYQIVASNSITPEVEQTQTFLDAPLKLKIFEHSLHSPSSKKN